LSVAFYFDEHSKSSLLRALRQRGVDVVSVQEDGLAGAADPDVLDRATRLGRVVFSQDDDFLVEAARRQRAGLNFAGVIYARQNRVTVRQCIEQLEFMATCAETDEFRSQVVYLPLW
jgi:predicted nuclease of predicted toxin-antitoxin system